MNETGPFGKGCYDYLVHAQLVHTVRRRRDVRNGIHRSDFMKMDFMDLSAVDRRLCFRHDREDFFRQRIRPLRKPAAPDHFQHIGKVPVLMVMVFVVMPVVVMMMVMLVDRHLKICSGKAVFASLFQFERNMFQLQSFQHTEQPGTIHAQIRHRRHKHIAADAGCTFKIQNLSHFAGPPFTIKRLIWAAR